MDEAVVGAVVLVRFFLPLLIINYPLPAIIACLVVDAADHSIFQLITDDPMPGYQAYDKALDVFYLALAYISSMRNWRDDTAFGVTRFLYMYRLVGVTLFELFHHRWLLFIFPNTFEYFFIAYEFVRTRWNPSRLSRRTLLLMAAAIWVFIKLPQEWWIHIAHLDFNDFMSDHSYMWIVIGCLFAIVAIVLWIQRERIPKPDWALTFNVNRHLPPLNYEIGGSERFFNNVLLEKAAFLAMITVIFAQVVPGARMTNLELTACVLAVVVLNAAVGQWLQRRGRNWASTLQTFVAALVINAGIALLAGFIGKDDIGDDATLAVLFFVLLMSLLIALFDRYRATRSPRNDHLNVATAETHDLNRD
jgi:hypothetical protein